MGKVDDLKALREARYAAMMAAAPARVVQPAVRPAAEPASEASPKPAAKAARSAKAAKATPVAEAGGRSGGRGVRAQEHEQPVLPAPGRPRREVPPVQVTDWAAQRAHAVAVHAADLARRESTDADRAAEMLREFVAAARERGLVPVDLRARSHDGRRRYRTGRRGWPLGLDGRFAVDEEAGFHILSVRGSLRACLSGMTLTPARPRLFIGEGGGDGERIALADLLARTLDAG